MDVSTGRTSASIRAGGTELTTFATVTITGELKRHLRDRGWSVRLPRACSSTSTCRRSRRSTS